MLQNLGPQNQTFYALLYDASQLPSGTVLTIYNSTTCTEQLETWSLFKPSTAYTVSPGIVSFGSIASDYTTFLSLQLYVPISGGPIEVGLA